ncbi:CorA Metal Ion (Mg2+/Co2+) transporter [Stanieria sp. NIES-3757]|nr:CorA Metal Ion (Mg2+/Co2+) transporter [Stanieria sp. NIES-3757]
MLKIDSTYGSDQNGLVWGYRFMPCQPGESITAEAATEFLTLPDSADSKGFVWLHFSLSNSASELWLQRNLNLPEPFYDTLHDEVGSTRLEQDADSLIAVIYDVLFDFAFDASAAATASLFIQPRLLVSVRLRPLRSIDRLRAAVRTGRVFRSTIELLAHLLHEQADVLVDILRQSTLRVDRIEDKLMANRITISRIELGSLRRVLIRLQRLLAPEPAALFRLLNRPPEWISEADLQDLQQAAEEFSAAVGDAAALIERVKLLQEELTAQVNEQTNRTLFVLTVVTVLALPINLVAGLFGMNVGGIPLTDNHYGFFAIVGILSILTLLSAYLAFGKQRN